MEYVLLGEYETLRSILNHPDIDYNFKLCTTEELKGIKENPTIQEITTHYII